MRFHRTPILLPTDAGFHPSANGRNGWKFSDIYDVGEEIGRGTFGDVYTGTHKFAQQQIEQHGNIFATDWRHVAIKRTKPNQLDLYDARGQITKYGHLERYCQEVKTLLKLKEGSPTICPVLYLYEIFMAGRNFYAVTDKLDQDLHEWRCEMESFTEKMAINICKTVLRAVDFMHSRDVVHRDLKLQNIMFRKRGDFRSLKIIDFGLARVLGPSETAKELCGSIGYIAPEIYLGEAYRFEVDMFAFGVALFRLLSGERPFPDTDPKILERQTIEYRYTVNSENWQNVSSAAKDLIRKLLINKQERLTAQGALAHPWFREEGSSILPPDLTYISTANGGFQGDGRSQAVVRSQAPHRSSTSTTDGRFWIDAELQIPIVMIISAEIYSAREVNERRTDQHSSGLICIEELEKPECMSLPDYVMQLPTFTEKDCRNIMLKLARAIQTMHDAGIAHRDLSLKNVIIDILGKVSLRGLRYAQPIVEGVPLTGHFGSSYSWYAFKAPEVDRAFVHDKSIDLWSLGAIMYMMLTGLPPFRGCGMELTQRKHAGFFRFDVVPVSPYAEALVRNLLQVAPGMRYTIDDVLNDRWMIEADDFLEEFDLQLARDGFENWNNEVG